MLERDLADLAGFRKALEDLRAKAQSVAAQWADQTHKGEDDPPPSLVEIQTAILWQQLRSIEAQYLEVLQAQRRWKLVCRSHSGSGLLRIYKNDAGQLAHLPEAFCAAFLRGEVLDLNLVESSECSSNVKLTRADAIESEFPKTLLDHLVAERDAKASPDRESSAA